MMEDYFFTSVEDIYYTEATI